MDSDFVDGLPEHAQGEATSRAMQIESELAQAVAEGLKDLTQDLLFSIEGNMQAFMGRFQNQCMRQVAERMAVLEYRLQQLEDRAEVEDHIG